MGEILWDHVNIPFVIKWSPVSLSPLTLNTDNTILVAKWWVHHYLCFDWYSTVRKSWLFSICSYLYSFISLWPHGFLLYSVSYNILLSFILILNFCHIWSTGISSSSLLCPFDFLSSFFLTHQGVPSLSGTFPCPSHFSKEPWFFKRKMVYGKRAEKSSLLFISHWF